MEAVEIKTEPLDEYSNQIVEEEVIIKSENEQDYISDIHSREPEVQITEDWIEPKEEPTIEPETEPEPLTPTRSLKEDRLREESNPELVSNHCKFCNMFFKSRTTLKLHERNCQHKNDCSLCGQKFVTSYALNTHLNKIHNRMTENVSPPNGTTRSTLGRPPNKNPVNSDNLCDICSLKFANSRDLNNHKKKHNTCQQCGENFKSYGDLMEHTCENVPIKEEAESENDSPTKKIFRATNSMVVIPGQEVQTPIKASAKVKNAKPKKRKARVLLQTNFNESSSDNETGKMPIETLSRSPKSSFSVVTKDTDFEAFAQQMMKGFTDISAPVEKPKEKESISDQILRKLQIPINGVPERKSSDSKESEVVAKTELDAKDDDPQPDNIIVDSEGNFYKILEENLLCQPTIIKDEPLDDDDDTEDEPDEEPVKPKMPFPMPFIKDEPPDDQDQPADVTDSTDFLLEELFDRKAKSIAKVRETKFPFNPSFEPNGLGFKVKKEINGNRKISKSSDFSSPKKKKRAYNYKNPGNVGQSTTKLLPLEPVGSSVSRRKALSSSVSRRKALPHNVKCEIVENVTLPAFLQTNFVKHNKIVIKNKKNRRNTKSENVSYVAPKVSAKVKGKLFSKVPDPNEEVSNSLNIKLPTLQNTYSDKKLPIPFQNQHKPKQSKLLISQNRVNELYELIGKQGLELGFSTVPIPVDNNSTGEENSSSALLIDSAGDETPYSSDYNCTSADADHTMDNVEMTSIEDRVSLKSEPMECDENDINSTSENTPTSQIEELGTGDNTPKADFGIPANCEFDFEEVIRSSKLPNFNNVNNVIKKLTEEYQKAEKVKLEDPPAFAEVDSQAKQVLPEAIKEEKNRPNSLFFPMLDDTQVYNMVANALNEKYRYVWICPMCPRQYTQIKPFKKHLLTIHFRNTSELEGKAFELRPEMIFDAGPDETFCHLCHVTLADNASLRKHQIELHKDQDLTLRQKKKPLLHRCYICSKLCSSRTLLAEHMKSDCGKNPQYACNVCDKKFHTKSTLNLHKTMHTGELPHMCKFCQKRFRTRGQLTVHTRTHTGEKPFPCKVCGQCFTHRETLIAHLSRHIDMKRYKCYGCDQFFSCISGLKTHRTVRPETCGRVELNARAVGPRVRVIKGNVIFEPQPIYNARLAKVPKPCLESYILDHNYFKKDPSQTKKVVKQTIKSEPISIMPFE